jgi:hypothetical protein
MAFSTLRAYVTIFMEVVTWLIKLIGTVAL